MINALDFSLYGPGFESRLNQWGRQIEGSYYQAVRGSGVVSFWCIHVAACYSAGSLVQTAETGRLLIRFAAFSLLIRNILKFYHLSYFTAWCGMVT